MQEMPLRAGAPDSTELGAGDSVIAKSNASAKARLRDPSRFILVAPPRRSNAVAGLCMAHERFERQSGYNAPAANPRQDSTDRRAS
jgi:hypothetical protein